MSVRLRPEAFRHELAIRGISQAELARDAGLSQATVSAAARGLPVAPATLRHIGQALAKRPVLELSELVAGSSAGDGITSTESGSRSAAGEREASHFP